MPGSVVQAATAAQRHCAALTEPCVLYALA